MFFDQYFVIGMHGYAFRVFDDVCNDYVYCLSVCIDMLNLFFLILLMITYIISGSTTNFGLHSRSQFTEKKHVPSSQLSGDIIMFNRIIVYYICIP